MRMKHYHNEPRKELADIVYNIRMWEFRNLHKKVYVAENGKGSTISVMPSLYKRAPHCDIKEEGMPTREAYILVEYVRQTKHDSDYIDLC